MIQVVDIRLHEVESRLQAQKKLKLNVDQGAKDWLAAAGFNPSVSPPTILLPFRAPTSSLIHAN